MTNKENELWKKYNKTFDKYGNTDVSMETTNAYVQLNTHYCLSRYKDDRDDGTNPEFYNCLDNGYDKIDNCKLCNRHTHIKHLHNGAPVTPGLVCTTCNREKVIPERVKVMGF